MRFVYLVFTFVLSFTAVQANTIPEDPYGSPMWSYLAEDTFGADAVIKVDKRLKVYAPVDAESNFQVPVSVDATALGDVEEIVLMTDLNPFPIALRFFPMAAKPYFATRVKLNEASVIHAIARTTDGVWHMNGSYVTAEGGGCAAGPQQLASSDWADHLLETQGKVWQRGSDQRLRLRIRHPMDTGLHGDVPVFILEDIKVRDENGNVISRFQLREPVSENPVLTLEFENSTRTFFDVSGRDNNANSFKTRLEAQP